MKKCAVIGSINMDLDISVPYFPHAGETLTGMNYITEPGGKGANQAVALGRLGADVCMAGQVGADAFGKNYLAHFEANGVDVRTVAVREDATTGIANILINAEGENYIVLVPGANAKCDIAWLDSVMPALEDCDIFLLQLEIPLETVREAVLRLRKMGKTIILDPAPAVPLDAELLGAVDYVTPNETELKIITSFLPEDADTQARIAALVGDSDRVVIHKCGGNGAFIATKDGSEHVPGFKVKVVDTTAAGDTFNAGMAYGLANGMTLKEAVRFANATGALAVTAMGAQRGMPTQAQAQALMQAQA